MLEVNRGSEWRKWDLHIHTPASFHWEGGKKFQDMTKDEKSLAIKEIIEKLNDSDIAAFAIMDYFTFDGFLEIRNYLKEHPDIKLNKTLFPGIELRIEAPVDYRLNIHAIFCENITDQELIDFKSTLKIFGSDEMLSKEGIIKTAKNLPGDKAKIHIGTQDYKNNDDIAFRLGIETIKITRSSFEEAVKKLTKEKCLVILPFDTNDGVENLNWKKHSHEACYFFQLADIFEARNKDDIDLILNIKTEKNKDFIHNFFQTMGDKEKPAVSGSDAHKITDYGNYPNGKATWIKAETTFRGLIQATIEPLSRTFIGEKPGKLISLTNKPTKFISRIEIKKVPDEKFDESWFNNAINFNPELIAIIGNKGSGKSALADILGLSGSSRQEEHFSFLNKDKFRERQSSKAKKYQATIHWFNKDASIKNLSDSFEESSVEQVKYIPQNYLEKLCNEITPEGSLFDKELKNVIFSHISEDQKLGHETLDKLILYKTEEINKEINLLRNNLHSTLRDILESEEKATEQYEKTLIEKLQSKQKELEAHNKIKPVEQIKPNNEANDGASFDLIKNLENLQKEEQKLNQITIQNHNQLAELNKKREEVSKLLKKIDLIANQHEQSIEEIKEVFQNLGLSINDVISFKVNRHPIEKMVESLTAQINNTLIDLNEEVDYTSAWKLKNTKISINQIAEKIDEPNRKYQVYLEELEKWNVALHLIKGDQTKPGTIEYLNCQITDIKNIPAKINELEETRDNIVLNIFERISGLADIYRQFYDPVQKFVDEKPFSEDTFKMSFDVSIIDVGFAGGFFNRIDRSRMGTFYGVEESQKYLAKIINKYNFNSSDDIRSFVREIIRCLKSDCRDDKGTPSNITAQVKDRKVMDLYDFVFSLKYIEPKYSLKLNGKSIEQLSPGERGTLLLIFYLMVDKDDRPLIIDQPEENLDNQTIFKVLVPCIKNAKKNRQLFIVTHNPNLAVVCDAEQIIYASIDKSDSNRVEYHSGSIENKHTNSHIINILEGTRPAFNNRNSKYFS